MKINKLRKQKIIEFLQNEDRKEKIKVENQENLIEYRYNDDGI